MPLPQPIRPVLLGLVTALAVLGCGRDAQPAEPAEPPPRPRPVDTADPLGGIPREELYGASPAENVWSPRYEFEVLGLPHGWDGARFAIISDPHLGRWADNPAVATAAVRAAVAENPDVYLLLGDFVAEGDDMTSLRQALAPLGGRRSLAVLGSRDVRTDSIEAMITRTLEAVGVQVLNNASVPLERNGDTILVAGLDPEIVQRTWADQQFILATLGEAERTPILLTFAPALVTRAPMGRFPIVIGGNTFCGPVEVPGTPRISWLRNEIFPNAAIEGRDRLFRVQGSTVLVACGIGYGFVPTRFGAPPEVPIVTLVRAGAAPAAPEENGPVSMIAPAGP